jgi:hypothetical protein
MGIKYPLTNQSGYFIMDGVDMSFFFWPLPFFYPGKEHSRAPVRWSRKKEREN